MGSTGRSFLGEIEARLRRALNLQGLIPVKLNEPASVTPVLIVGDATLPGMSDYRGRNFARAVVAGAGNTCLFRAVGSSVIIDRIVISAGSVAILNVVYVPPTAGLALGALTGPVTVPLIDGRDGELAPAEMGTLADAAVVGGVQIIRVDFQNINHAAPLVIPLPMLLRPGACVGFESTGVINQYLSVQGRIF